MITPEEIAEEQRRAKEREAEAIRQQELQRIKTQQTVETEQETLQKTEELSLPEESNKLPDIQPNYGDPTYGAELGRSIAQSGRHGNFLEMSEEGKTTQKVKREEGVVNQTMGLLAGLTPQNWLNSIAAGINALTPDQLTQLKDGTTLAGGPLSVLKPLTQAFDDFALSKGEQDAITEKIIASAQEDRAAGGGNLLTSTLEGTLENLYGIQKGMQGGLMIPQTLLARLNNEATDWADPPEVIKESGLASTAFEVAQILTPSLLAGAFAGPGGFTVTGRSTFGLLAAESAIETVTQDSAEDLLLGRRLVSGLGDIYGDITGNKEAGRQLTIDLIEGNKPHAQVLNAVAGFIQNLGINYGAEELFHYAFKKLNPQKLLKEQKILKPQQILGEQYYTTDPNLEFFTGDVGINPRSLSNIEALNTPYGTKETRLKDSLIGGIYEDGIGVSEEEWGELLSGTLPPVRMREIAETLRTWHLPETPGFWERPVWQEERFSLKVKGMEPLRKYALSDSFLKRMQEAGDEEAVKEILALREQAKTHPLYYSHFEPHALENIESWGFRLSDELDRLANEQTGIIRFEQQDFPNGAQIGWTFFNADEDGVSVALKKFDWSPLTDISRRKVDIEFQPQNDILLGNRAIRLRSFFNNFVRNNLEPGDIVMNTPNTDDVATAGMSQAQIRKQIAFDEQISARQVQAIEDNFDNEEVWQYFGDLGIDKNYNQLSDSELALKYLSEDEYRIWNQSPRVQRMQPGLEGRVRHLTDVAKQRAGADVQGFVNTKEGVKQWWDSLDDSQKALEAQTAIENEIIKEPPYDDLTPNVRASIYEGIGFSKVNNQEYQLAKGSQFGVLRKYPGPRNRLVDPLDIKFEGKQIANIEEVRAQILAAKRAEPYIRPLVNEEGAKTLRKIAKATETTIEEAQEALDDVKKPSYNTVQEPHDSMTIDTAVPVARGSDTNRWISDPALIRELLKDMRIGLDDYLTAADRDFFTNWEAIATEEGLIKALQMSTATLKKLQPASTDVAKLQFRAKAWIEANASLIDDGHIDEVLEKFSKSNFVRTLNGEDLSKATKETKLRKQEVSQEGFIVAAAIGEELGVRLQKLARAAVNLENVNVDFTKTIDNLLELQEKANLFLLPLRRGKRRWAAEGTIQQKKSLAKVKDLDFEKGLKDAHSFQESARSMQTIGKYEGDDTAQTLRELWEAYKNGDIEAGKTMKMYLNAIAYEDPLKVLQQVEDLNTIMLKQLKQGNRNAIQQLYYGSLLSRVATQTASAASGIAQLVALPLGQIGSGVVRRNAPDIFEGIGQLVGGIQQINSALEVGIRSWNANRSLMGGNKIAQGVGNLQVRQKQLDALYEGAKKELVAKGAGPQEEFGAFVWYATQTMANHPFTHAGMRALTGMDDAIKSVYGSQIATGRAFRKAVNNDDMIAGLHNIESLVNDEFNKVFLDGTRTGIITDTEVLEAAQRVTFQNKIPYGSKNPFTNAFRAMQNASDQSAIFKFFTPFVRVTYNTLESTVRHSLVGIPGFTNLPYAKVYGEILAGDMGAVAQQQLKSQIAWGRMWGASIAYLAWNGSITGSQTQNMPKNSFIVPSPGTKDGYIAIPYGRLEPFAGMTSVIADLVNGLKDRVIGEGQYDTYLQEIMLSIGMASFDKSFMTGQQKFAELTNIRNWNRNGFWAANVANLGGSLSPSFNRMIGDFISPYKTVSKGNSDDFWETLIGTIRQRAFGGIGNPVRYDEFDGKKIPKVSEVGSGDNYWLAVGGSILNEFIWPGKISNARTDDPVTKKLKEIGFEPDRNWLSTLGSQKLTLEEQSALSKEIAPSGNLYNKLENYLFKDKSVGGFNQKYKNLQHFAIEEGSSMGNTFAHQQYREGIFQDIRRLYSEAKREAAEFTILNDAEKDRRFQLKVEGSNPDQALPPNLPRRF